MSFLEAVFLGVIQGITEFLPISSSGHLKILQVLLGTNPDKSFMFTVVVHGATVIATIIVFWKKIAELFTDIFKFKWNESTQYAAKIVISMIPIAIVGLFLKNYVDEFFGSSGIILVGYMLIITAFVLFLAWKLRGGNKDVGFWHSFIIGFSQAIAVLPGLSRSGVTISTALLLKIDRAKAAQFSFLMVILPVLAEIVLDTVKGNLISDGTSISILLTGFISAFITGYIACKFMLGIVTRGKIQYFAIYCLLIGVLCIIFDL
jgi:undecaprenyl-diphosphatase